MKTPRRDRSASHAELCEGCRVCPAPSAIALSNRISTRASIRCTPFSIPSTKLSTRGIEEISPDTHKRGRADGRRNSSRLRVQPYLTPTESGRVTHARSESAIIICDKNEIKSEVAQPQSARGSSNRPGYLPSPYHGRTTARRRWSPERSSRREGRGRAERTAWHSCHWGPERHISGCRARFTPQRLTGWDRACTSSQDRPVYHRTRGNQCPPVVRLSRRRRAYSGRRAVITEASPAGEVRAMSRAVSSDIALQTVEPLLGAHGEKPSAARW